MLRTLSSLACGILASNQVPTSAVGPVSASEDLAIRTLAACPSYRAFLGVESEAEAIARTYVAALPAPTDGLTYSIEEWEFRLRPYGIVHASRAGGYRSVRTAYGAFSERGRMLIELEKTVPTDYSPSGGQTIDLTQDLEAADRWIKNQVGAITNDLESLAGQPGYMDIGEIGVVMGPSREDHREKVGRGCFYWVMIELAWGSE